MYLKPIIAIVAVLALSACSSDTAVDSGGDIPSGIYAVDSSHASITFYYLHQGLSFPLLRATAVAGELQYDANDIENSSVRIAIATDSIRSNIDYFDDELASRKFFNAERYPHITFRSDAYEAIDEKTGVARGQATIRGVTQPLEFGVTMNGALIHPMLEMPVIGFSATGSLNRSDFGLDRFIPDVSDTVEFRIEIEFLHGSNEASQAAVAAVSQAMAGR
ncbi:MAG: YceI family protein [Woeseiaceae bacterium]|jgi:polyisoprenoid-binding protein YceI|nr:YceI family protein [Woeseiaceae bacterium]